MGVAESYVIDNAGTQDKHWVEGSRELTGFLTMFECTHENPSLVNVREMLGLPYERKSDFWDDAGTGVAVAAKAGREQPQKRTVRGAEKLDGNFQQGGTVVLAGVAKQSATLHGGWYGTARGAGVGAHANPMSRQRSLAGRTCEKDSGFRFEADEKEDHNRVRVFPPSELEKHSRWLRMVVGARCREMLKTPASEKVGPVLFLLDEFAALGTFAPINQAVGTGARAMVLSLDTVMQNLPQLKEDYRDGSWENFIAACGASDGVCTAGFDDGRVPFEALRHDEKEVQSVSQDRETLQWRPTIGSQGFPLFLPQDLMGMEDRRAAVPRAWSLRHFKTRGVRYTKRLSIMARAGGCGTIPITRVVEQSGAVLGIRGAGCGFGALLQTSGLA